MYKVLKVEGEGQNQTREIVKIKPNEFNPEIHKHNSGREFTKDESIYGSVKEITPKGEEEIKLEDIEIVEVDGEREELEKQYLEKFGRKANPNTKTETLKEKLSS